MVPASKSSEDFIAARKKVAGAIEARLDEVQRLMAILDLLEGDADLEPSLAAADLPDQSQWAAGPSDDRESDPCDGPIDDDDRDSGAEFSTEHQHFGPPAIQSPLSA